jgi:hypothetical protein
MQLTELIAFVQAGLPGKEQDDRVLAELASFVFAKCKKKCENFLSIHLERLDDTTVQ